MTQKIHQIDIRDGEYFAFGGPEIKVAVDAKIQNVLRPGYEKALNKIAELVGDSDGKGVAALLVSLAGDPNDWAAVTSEIKRNADIACEHSEEIQSLARMASAFSDDAQYIINEDQLKRFGLGS